MKLLNKGLRQKDLDKGFLLALSLFFSFCLSPSRTTSLGITSGDDGPVLPSISYKYYDSIGSNVAAQDSLKMMWTTSTKWLPAILYKFFSLDPILFHFIMTHAQIILIVVGVFRLAYVISDSRAVAYISVGLTIIYEPYFINMGWYGDQFFMPYSTWLAIGPLLLAWANLLENQNKKSIIYLLIGTSIHPSMGFCALFMIIVTKVDLKDLTMRKCLDFYIPATIVVFAISLLSTLPIRLAQYRDPSSLRLLPAVTHWEAWKLSPDYIFSVGTTFTVVFTISIFSIIYSLKSKLNSYYLISIKVLTASAILVLIQSLAYSIEIREIYSASLGRITIFSSIFFTIISAIVLNFFLMNYRTFPDPKIVVVIIFCLLFPSFGTLAILTFILLLKSLLNKKISKSQKLILTLVFLTTTYFYILSFRNLQYSVSNYQLSGDFVTSRTLSLRIFFYVFNFYTIFLLLAIFLALVYFVTKKKFLIHKFIIWMLIFLSLVTVVGRLQLSLVRGNEHLSWVKAQEWARDNTDPESIFLTRPSLDAYESWSTLSKRIRIIVDGDYAGAYLYSEADNAYNKARRLHPNSPLETASASSQEEFFGKFSTKFGGNYLVTAVSNTQLGYKIVYMNSKYVIYLIN